MANGLMAQVFGGGSQVAPQYSTLNPSTIQSQFLGQNFAGEQQASNNITANTSQANLSTNLAGLNQVDSGALQGINAEQNLGNSLLTGSASQLPGWAQTYLNKAQSTGAEGAVQRGVGSFSGTGISGINQFAGQNALQLVGMGANFANSASQQSQGIVNANMYRNDPNNSIMSIPELSQIGEFNTGIQNQQANANAGVTNANNNNSPWGNMIRTGLQTVGSLAGSFLGDSSLGSAFSTSGNGAAGPIQGNQSSGGSGGGGGGLASLFGGGGGMGALMMA